MNDSVLRLPIATRVFTVQAQPPPKWDAPKPLVLPRTIGQRLMIHDHETRDEPGAASPLRLVPDPRLRRARRGWHRTHRRRRLPGKGAPHS